MLDGSAALNKRTVIKVNIYLSSHDQHWWFSGKIGRCHSRSTISVDSASPGFDSRPMHGYVHSFLARLLLLLNPRMSDVPALVYSAAYEEIAKDEALLGCETKESCAVKFC